MADDKRISELAELAVYPAVGDLFCIVDVSDTSMAATGTDKKIRIDTILDQSVLSGASPTFTNTNFTEATNKNYITDAQQTALHPAVTIGTANGLSLASQALSLAAATASVPGAATATQITKLDGIQAGATANVGDFLADGSVPMTGRLDLVTGTTTVAPIKMTAGVNLTTPVAGVMEWDGTDLFFSI